MTGRLSAADIAGRLADRVDALVRELLPGGHREGNAWRAGSVAGETGVSLSVLIKGDRRGRWQDFASGEHGDLVDLVAASLSLSAGEAIRWAKAWLGLADDGPAVHPRPRRAPEPTAAAGADDAGRKLARARAILSRSRPVRGTLAETYLKGRGLVLPGDGGLFDPTALRFAADCWHWPTESHLPALVGAVVKVLTGELQGLHLTYLRPDGRGKAEVDKARLYLGPKGGGCVKLTADADVSTGLAIGEGIETTLSALILGYPAWACLDAGNLASFPLLPGVESLAVLVDHDDAGRRAADAVARRWWSAGREVRLWTAVPDARGGYDLNDRLREARHG